MDARSPGSDDPAAPVQGAAASPAQARAPMDPATRLRRRTGQVLVDQFFIRASGLGALAPGAKLERHGVERIRDVPYLDTGSPDHMLDVYRPKGAEGPLPVVVYIHGGAFRALSKDTHWVFALSYARRGYVVFNVNYRLAPKHKYPAALRDLVEAWRFVVENAARFGGDVSRAVLAGESAGANLATALSIALCCERPEDFAARARAIPAAPKAVVAACGFLQITNGARFRDKHSGHWFWDDRYCEIEDDYLPDDRDASPGGCDLADPVCVLERGVAQVRPLPAFFLPVGGGDILMDDSFRLAAALSKLGVPNEARVYGSGLLFGGHAFHGFPIMSTARACWRDTYLFLERHGVAQPWPTPKAA